MKTNPPIPILVGPTGSGKTAAGLELARALGAEVISADSRQVYRHLSVGTAKPAGTWVNSRYMVEGIAHHLMDFLEPRETFSAGDFARQANELLKKGTGEWNNNPFVIVGGTGLYSRALVDGLAPLPPRNEALRKELTSRAEKEGRGALHAELARVDPESASKIPLNNIARLIRALEVHQLTDRPLSWWQKEKTTPSSLSYIWLGLSWPKNILQKLLEKRCHKMINNGLLEETSALLDRGFPPASPCFLALGYRLAIDHIQGRIGREELEKELVLQTRQYVKRQMTWFRANKRIHWIELQEPFDGKKTAEKLLRFVK